MNRIGPKSLRRKMGVVTQNRQLFRGIFSTIVISAPRLTLNDTREAAETAGIADDIREVSMGMEQRAANLPEQVFMRNNDLYVLH